MKKKRKMNKVLYAILDWSRVILTAFATAFIVSHTLIANAQVPSGSMETTIMTGSRIIVNRMAYIAGDPQRGDIIAFYYPDDGKTIYLKRIIGLPGERIEGINGTIYIDGSPLAEGYLREEMEGDFGPYVVPKDGFFVMGDNRNNSLDSRFWKNKFVEKSEIVGRAEMEYFPELKWL